MLDQAEKEVKALEGGKKASSARARKSLQSIKSNSHSLRKQIIEHTRGLPVKKREKKETTEKTPEVEPEPAPKPKVRKKKTKTEVP